MSSFDVQTLTKDAGFFSDAANTPTTVEGSGQMVYWRDCFIRVYKAGDRENPTERHSTCDGEGLVQKGINLWFGGKNGQVKEES